MSDADHSAYRGRLTEVKDIRTAVLAGNARLTLVSEKTGTRYTYRIKAPDSEDEGGYRTKKADVHFVSVLYGPDNEMSYSFMGTLFGRSGEKYKHGKTSNIVCDDVREKAFLYMWNRVRNDQIPTHLEVWHEGSCCRCGRALTVPESIKRGYGPECAAKMGIE